MTDRTGHSSGFLDCLDDGAAIFDLNGRLCSSNVLFNGLLGLPAENAVIGQDVEDISTTLADRLLGSDRPSSDPQADILQDLVGGRPGEAEISAADGTCLRIRTKALPDEGHIVLTRDMTRQRAAEEADTILKTIVEACPANFLVSRVDDGKVIYCPPGSRERFGGIVSTLEFFLKPEDRQTYLDALLPTGVLNDYPVIFRRGDGSLMRGLTSARVVEFEGEKAIVSSTRDITEQLQIQAELERQREIAYQNEKLSALGGLLAGVAHELNNPLSIIVGYAQMLKGRVQDPTLERRIDRICQAAERSARIVKTFLAMARQKPANRQICAVDDMLKIAVDLVGHGLQESGISLEVMLDADLPPVSADTDQLVQVFSNLILNAEHAISGNSNCGRIRIVSRRDPVSGQIAIEVEDDGTGIPPDILPRIFEPFFTTKREGEGTGIGLSLSRQIVESHGGTLTVQSRAGEGATFTVRLHAALEQDDDALTPVEEIAGRTGRILVVDDDVDVADLIRDLLIRDGHDVDVRNDAASALLLLQTKQFDAILSDIRMPGLDGRDFLNAIKRTMPRLEHRLGFITGDTGSPGIARFLATSNVAHLEKPVSRNDLNKLVQKLLDPEVSVR